MAERRTRRAEDASERPYTWGIGGALLALAAALLAALVAGCSGGARASAATTAQAAASAPEPPALRSSATDPAEHDPPTPPDPPATPAPGRLSYAGRDAHGVPHYIHRSFSARERKELRQVFGITDPDRLYLRDSTRTGFMKWDASPDHGRKDEVYSYSLGFVSLRHPGESWPAFRHRVQHRSAGSFPDYARTRDSALGELDPSVQSLFKGMISAAHAAGYPVQVIETYRSPEREAYLLSQADGKTYTATSLHSYGRAVDVMLGDGNTSHSGTRHRYIAFRHWVLKHYGGKLQLIGTAANTWDWGHLEAPAMWLGYHDVGSLLEAAHRCAAAGKPQECGFAPHLPKKGP